MRTIKYQDMPDGQAQLVVTVSRTYTPDVREMLESRVRLHISVTEGRCWLLRNKVIATGPASVVKQAHEEMLEWDYNLHLDSRW